jgi:DNA-binding response OmpR family regulator
MRFATLIHEQELRSQVSIALMSIGVEVVAFAVVGPLAENLRTQSFAAIVLEDSEDRIRDWLHALRTRTDERVAIIAIGKGGAARMSLALRHGADDYVVIADGVQQLVPRSIARIDAKTHLAREGTWRLGPYQLDRSRSSLVSAVADVHLSPRELLLAQVLIENHGRVVPLQKLCEVLCDRTDDAAKRAVKQHAHTLRRKCELAAGSTLDRLRIEPVYGKGYRLAL